MKVFSVVGNPRAGFLADSIEKALCDSYTDQNTPIDHISEQAGKLPRTIVFRAISESPNNPRIVAWVFGVLM